MNTLSRTILLISAIILSSIPATALTGSWRGELSLGPTKLPLVFNFTENEKGATLCTLDSPTQGAKGISTYVLYCAPDSIMLMSSSIGASYSGRIEGATIRGTFRQSGYSFPLILTPEIPADQRRPQTPRPPYPYTTLDTTFTAGDGAVLSGTLTLPDTKVASPPFTTVVMVTGSGPQNRDEEIFEHRPFAVLADYLARHGIASLRYDDRGTGQSTGDYASATTATFRDDARSAITFLRTLPQIGPVGVLGHSEGGTIAFMLGAEEIPDFIISLAGMAVSGKETILDQNGHYMELAGITGTDKDAALQLIGMAFDAIISAPERPVNVDSLALATGLDVPPAILSSLKANVDSHTPWFVASLALDGRDYLPRIKCPLLAINGSRDIQVNPANLNVINQLVPHSVTLLMPGLNHLMQPAVTGEISEYGEIPQTIAPEVLAAILSFLTAHLN